MLKASCRQPRIEVLRGNTDIRIRWTQVDSKAPVRAGRSLAKLSNLLISGFQLIFSLLLTAQARCVVRAVTCHDHKSLATESFLSRSHAAHTTCHSDSLRNRSLQLLQSSNHKPAAWGHVDRHSLQSPSGSSCEADATCNSALLLWPRRILRPRARTGQILIDCQGWRRIAWLARERLATMSVLAQTA